MHAAAPLFVRQPDWRLIFWITYIAWIAFELWISTRDRRAVDGDRLDRSSLPVILVLVALGILAAFVVPHAVPSAAMPRAGAAVFYAAMALMWGGIALRFWAVATLGPLFRTTVFVQAAHRLVTTGPYRVLRHPAYTGSLSTMAGLGLAMGNWLALGAPVLCLAAAYAWRIRVEEQALSTRFGAAFAEHRRRTWLLIPYLW